MLSISAEPDHVPILVELNDQENDANQDTNIRAQSKPAIQFIRFHRRFLHDLEEDTADLGHDQLLSVPNSQGLLSARSGRSQALLLATEITI